MTEPAAAYLRASTERQEYSPLNQMDAIKEYAADHGYTIVADYLDHGRSGLDMRGRPALRRLLQDVLAPQRAFRTLLVYDVSRWGRFQDPDEAAYYEFLCRQAGVDVVYCAEPFQREATTPFTAVLKSVKRAMAAEFSRDLSQKIYEAQRRTVLRGFSAQGRACYGLRRMLVDAQGQPKGLLEAGQGKRVHTEKVVFTPGPPNEIAVVNRIFRLCAEDGLPAARIAQRLNQDAVPGPQGRKWLGPTVYAMLRNERYVGTAVYGRQRTFLKQGRRVAPRSEWARTPNAFEAIVPQDLFDRAQARLAMAPRYQSDEELLKILAGVYRRKGYLTARAIKRDPHAPSPRHYKERFGSLRTAYALIGVRAVRKGHEAVDGEKEALLEALRMVWRTHGRLTRQLLARSQDVPNPGIYKARFGSLGAAYALIGFDRYRPAPSPDCGASRIGPD